MGAFLIIKELTKRGCTVSTAESCTGGLLASAFVDIPGSSACFKEGYVTYADEVKVRVLGIPQSVVDEYTVVSGECAAQMAVQTRRLTGSDYALSTTGIAGPDGGSDEKPVGLVYIACADSKKVVVREFKFKGNRNSVRNAAVEAALDLLGERLGIRKPKQYVWV